jgi:hypothetical protein
MGCKIEALTLYVCFNGAAGTEEADTVLNDRDDANNINAKTCSLTMFVRADD